MKTATRPTEKVSPNLTFGQLVAKLKRFQQTVPASRVVARRASRNAR